MMYITIFVFILVWMKISYILHKNSYIYGLRELPQRLRAFISLKITLVWVHVHISNRSLLPITEAPGIEKCELLLCTWYTDRQVSTQKQT